MKTISDIVGENGVFSDGDWVESKDQDPNGKVRLIQLADIGDGVFLDKSNRFLTEEKAIKLKCTFLEPGDILIARMPTPIGRACIFPNINTKAATAVDVCIVRPNNQDIHSPFIKYLINSDKFRNNINRHVTGTTRKRISRKNLNKIKFELPSFTNQIRIATLLSQIETLIQKRKESIDLLDELVKSTFLEMFGDPRINDRNWTIKQIAEITSSRLGKMLDKKKITGKYLKPYLGNSNVSWFGFKLERLKEMDFNEKDKKEFRLKEGDILMCEGGEIGRCAIWNNELEECYYQKALHRIRVKTDIIRQQYFVYYFWFMANMGGLEKFKGSATISHLTGATLKKMKIPVPNISLQNKFAQTVKKIESIKTKYQTSLEELENLYGSLSQRAFKGKLDLSKIEIEIPKTIVTEDKEVTAPNIDENKSTILLPSHKTIGKGYNRKREETEIVDTSNTKIITSEEKNLNEISPPLISKLTWENVSVQQITDWIKEKYQGLYFNIEMLIRFLTEDRVTSLFYFSSNDIKQNPALDLSTDLKEFIFSSLIQTDSFLKLEQVFYDAEKENFTLEITEEDYELIKDRSKKEQSGIYFRIIE